MKLCILIDAQSYEVEVGDLNTRPVLVTVDGETFQVWPEENGRSAAPEVQAVVPAAALAAAPVVSKPAAAAATVAPGERMKAVQAPIPGVILSIAVKAGDTVTFGQELCVLEAMKMKNQIRSNRAGTIAAVRVSPGDQVRHSQVLMDFTD